MSNLSNIAPTFATQQTPKAPVVDADGDNDGTKATAKPTATPQQHVSKPTETMGNNVNTTA